MKHSEAFENLVANVKPRITEITIEEVRNKQKDNAQFVLVDVREDHEWSAGHAPGAIHIGRGILERDIEKHVPNRDIEIVLYCGGGYRSCLAADNLQQMGYKRVYSMQGGFRGWLERTLPVTNS